MEKKSDSYKDNYDPCSQKKWEEMIGSINKDVPLSKECLSQYMSETFSLKGYPGCAKAFLNPFAEYTEKFTMFQGSPLDFLSGIKYIDDFTPTITPTIPFGILLSQLEPISYSLFATYYKAKDDQRLPDIRHAFENVEIYLVTVECEGKEHYVKNLFANGILDVRPQIVPKRSDGMEALGMYMPNTGSIYLWVDKIYGYRNYHLIFQMTLLHEIIHLLFDVIRKGVKIENSEKNFNNSKGHINEETLDNCLVLHCYAQADSPDQGQGVEYILKEVRSFINSQPPVYKDGGRLFDDTQNWNNMRSTLQNF